MTASTIYYESQYFTTTLSKVGGINASQTTGIVLQSVSGIFNTAKPGIALLNYADPLSTTTAEWVTFTSINSTTKTLVGVTRGAEGFSAKTHDNGITVAFPHSKSHINAMAALLEGIDTSDTVVGKSTTQTLTNKRVNPRTTTETSSATPTINTDNTDIHTITALATAITSMTTNLSGTPVNGQKLIIRIKDDGTARGITWGASFASRGATLPTTTVLGKYQYNGFIWNSTTSTWDCVATINEA